MTMFARSALMAQVRNIRDFMNCAGADRLCVVESFCYPNFDSPSIFARILDKDKVRVCPSQTRRGWP